MIEHHCRLEEPATWIKFRAKLCGDCLARCCSLPVEVSAEDLVRMGLIDAFELQDDLKFIARRLMKRGIIEHFNQKRELFTLARLANGDCIFLDGSSRRCTIYQKRPDTCKKHPAIGPRSGYCAYRSKPPQREKGYC